MIASTKVAYLALVVGCLALVNAAIAPRYAPDVLISAHRGANRAAPENTLAAFAKAIEQGTNFIEIDVRTSADGAQVIMHDASLSRTTGLEATVANTPVAEIRELSAGEWFGVAFRDERVPTLEEVCTLVGQANERWGRSVALYVDCKDIDPEKVVQALEKHRLLETAVFYGDRTTLLALKHIYGKARLMPAYPGRDKVTSVIKSLGPYAFDVRFTDLDKALVADCHGRNIRVFSDLLGKFDTPASYRAAVELGIDLIQTDDVPAVRAVLKENKP